MVAARCRRYLPILYILGFRAVGFRVLGFTVLGWFRVSNIDPPP